MPLINQTTADDVELRCFVLFLRWVVVKCCYLFLYCCCWVFCLFCLDYYYYYFSCCFCFVVVIYLCNYLFVLIQFNIFIHMMNE